MYISTRGGQEKISAANAIKNGIAGDGGLFVPALMPQMDKESIASLTELSYQQRAFIILRQFLTDYTDDELNKCIYAAYNNEKFDCQEIAPLVSVGENSFVLELWHGPTSAFKDMALQLLPQLLSTALHKTGETAEIVILVATSGDTGKAALEGFRDVDQIKIIVFFPRQGVSEIQRLQMITQEGSNVAVVAVNGNFDDAQTGVKRIFNNSQFNQILATQGFHLSSANSINWGRLAPQIVYYFSAYADMVRGGRITAGQPVNFVVPTGNFGNILAGYYAKMMGLPVNRLICASNTNNVLTEFLRTGVYNRLRPFHKTYSPSMDILISSNLERLLYHITSGDTTKVCSWMDELNTNGSYTVGEEYLKAIQEIFWADWADDSKTVSRIKQVYERFRYVADPHTAVAWQASESYRQQTGDKTPIVIVSTASPFKFNESVLTAIGGADSLLGKTEFSMLQELSRITGWPVPPALGALEHKKIRHQKVCDKENMTATVKELLESI